MLKTVRLHLTNRQKFTATMEPRELRELLERFANPERLEGYVLTLGNSEAGLVDHIRASQIVWLDVASDPSLSPDEDAQAHHDYLLTP